MKHTKNDISRRVFLGVGAGGVSAVWLGGCGSSYTVTPASVANGLLSQISVAGVPVGDLGSGNMSDATPVAEGASFEATYTVKSHQATGQVTDNPELRLFEKLPVLGTAGLIALNDDGKTGIAVLNDTGEHLYEARVVPADGAFPPFGTSSAEWEFLQVFRGGGWPPDHALFIVGLPSDRPRGTSNNRYDAVIAKTAAGELRTLAVVEEVESSEGA